jgi:hypothetical protein
MALLGRGAFVAWHDIAAGREADYHVWHSREHMLERVAIPGFLRAAGATSRPRTGPAISSRTRSPRSPC